MSSFAWRVVDNLGIYGQSSWRKILLPAALLPILTLGYLGFEKRNLPITASLVIPLCLILIAFLSIESISALVSLVAASLRERLILMRRLDKELDDAIDRAENASSEMDESEVRSLAREFSSDFENKRPFPRLLRMILPKIFVNFIVTIVCFSLITMSLLSLSLFYHDGNPYRHNCFTGDFFKALVHFFYYHSVIFQSLGDGDHVPQTLVPQIFATAETFVAFLYTLLIFASIFSSALYVESELTPEKLSRELSDRLLSLRGQASARMGSA